MAAIPVYPINLNERQIEAGPAEMVYGIGVSSGQLLEAGSSQPVYIVTDADLAAGRFTLTGNTNLRQMFIPGDNRPVLAGPARPIYIRAGFLASILAINLEDLSGYWEFADSTLIEWG